MILAALSLSFASITVPTAEPVAPSYALTHADLRPVDPASFDVTEAAFAFEVGPAGRLDGVDAEVAEVEAALKAPNTLVDVVRMQRAQRRASD